MPPRPAPDINAFLHRRSPNWQRLEHLLAAIERRGLESLTPEEVRDFGRQYRMASSDLVSARARTANAEILQYLNDLVARAYAHVYRSRRFHLRDAWTFLRLDFPRLLRKNWRPVTLATVVSLLAAAFGWELNQADPSGAFYMLPPEMVKSIPTMKAMWKGRSGHETSVELLAMMPAISAFIMTHNIGVGVTAFAGGLLFGIASILALVQNGMMLGILGEAMTEPETAITFWSLILPHGIVELSAIFIMGAAGLMLGGAILAPGRRSRVDALIERGREAVYLCLGAAAMLVLAGVIEGFITPPDFIPRWAKLLFAAGTLVAEVAYWARAGRGREPGLVTAGD